MTKEEKMRRRDEYSTWTIVGGILFAGLLITIVVLLAVDINHDSSNQQVMLDTMQQHQTALLDGQANIIESALGTQAKPGTPPPPPSTTCDVAIIGAGPGGLTMAYRLAPIYGSRLCVFDDRDHVGGKVHSIRYTASSDTRPVWTPTHAEQFRGGDTILRCMAQEVGSIMVVRGGPGTFYDVIARGINVTRFPCFGDVSPNGTSATCINQLAFEAVIAPNGQYPENYTSPYGDLLNPCGNKDWRTCSYSDAYFTMLTSASNANSIIVGETFFQYASRILGVNGANYFSETYGYGYLDEKDARSIVDYLIYDYTFPYGHVHMHHGGPQVGTWNRVAKLISTNGSRIILNTRIQSIDTTSTGAYKLVSGGGLIVNAMRVVLAFPPNHLNTMSGSVVNTLVQMPQVSYSSPVHACTWNAFFPTRFWKEHTSTCNYGWCTTGSIKFNLTGYARENYMQWNYAAFTQTPDSLDFVQYVATPERNESNLLRFFFEEDPCRALDIVYATSGAAGIQTELMRRLHLALDAVIPYIPDPVEAYYSSEVFAEASLAPGAPFRATEWLKWATEPMPGKKLCFATEGVNMFDSGWQEGAAKVAHNCLRGNVFKDVVSSTAISALERCRANISSGANRYLDNGNKNSGNDVCLLLRNEYHMRDLANYTYCGSPKVYDYPTLASFTSNSYQPNQLLWQNALTTPLYEVPVTRCRGHHC